MGCFQIFPMAPIRRRSIPVSAAEVPGIGTSATPAPMAVAMFVTGMHMSFSTSSAASPEPSVPPEIEEARQMVTEAENELRAASEAEKLFFEVQVEQAHAHLGMLLEEHERSDHN